MGKIDAGKFAEDGYLVLENFISDADADKLRSECAELVSNMNPEEHRTVFSGKDQSYRDEYFINSADKVGFFLEKGAIDDQGNLQVEKHRSLNKIGHALHVFCPTFKRITHSADVKDLARSLGYKDPVIPQSMYIFKQPKIGGEVVPHQDSTYLHTDPIKVMGIWIALQDATEQNGCLWFWPGSHKSGIHGDYVMVRNTQPDGPTCVYEGEKPTPDDSKFIPVPVKKGSAIVIDGLVVHKSAHNHSDHGRHIYTFHIYDHAEAKWSPRNWLQPTEAGTFTHLYEM